MGRAGQVGFACWGIRCKLFLTRFELVCLLCAFLTFSLGWHPYCVLGLSPYYYMCMCVCISRGKERCFLWACLSMIAVAPLFTYRAFFLVLFSFVIFKGTFMVCCWLLLLLYQEVWPITPLFQVRIIHYQVFGKFQWMQYWSYAGFPYVNCIIICWFFTPSIW